MQFGLPVLTTIVGKKTTSTTDLFMWKLSQVSDNIDWAVVPGVKLIPLSFFDLEGVVKPKEDGSSCLGLTMVLLGTKKRVKHGGHT